MGRQRHEMTKPFLNRVIVLLAYIVGFQVFLWSMGRLIHTIVEKEAISRQDTRRILVPDEDFK